MNFLKIALSNKLKNNDFNSWQTTNLNNNPQASELAAIVLALRLFWSPSAKTIAASSLA